MNKKSVFFLVSIFCLSMSGCQKIKQDSDNYALSEKVEVESSETAAYLYIQNNMRDFGTIQKDKQSTTTIIYEFTNTGNLPLVCIKASPSCGCMEADIPTHPIRPGEKGEVRVNVNLLNEKGRFNKNVILKTNAENDVVLLRIKGNVK